MSQKSSQVVDATPATDTAAWTEQASDQCPDCGGTEFVSEGSETYCQKCSVIITESSMERSVPGWTESRDRHWGPAARQQWLQRGTCVGTASDSIDADTARFSRYNTRLLSNEQSIHRGLRELRGTCEELEVGTYVRERAAKLYRDAVHEGLLQGRSIEAFADAAVFVALREIEYPITFGWLADVTLAEETEISDAYRQLLSECDLRVLPPKPKDFLPRVASHLGVAPAVERSAGQILSEAKNGGLSNGKHPAGFAGSAIYVAAQQHDVELTQAAVAEATDVNVVTISRRSKEIGAECDFN